MELVQHMLYKTPFEEGLFQDHLSSQKFVGFCILARTRVWQYWGVPDMVVLLDSDEEEPEAMSHSVFRAWRQIDRKILRILVCVTPKLSFPNNLGTK